MLSLAALVLAAASTSPTPMLTSASPWWEKVTYTISGDGAQQSCQYESSVGVAGDGVCDDEPSGAIQSAASGGATGAYTKITIERRFTPGAQPEPGSMVSGDTLLGGQVMALTIDGTGAVRGCKVLAASGDVRPAYGCTEARAERFEASATRELMRVKQGFMTILVYGHEEELV